MIWRINMRLYFDDIKIDDAEVLFTTM